MRKANEATATFFLLNKELVKQKMKFTFLSYSGLMQKMRLGILSVTLAIFNKYKI